MIDPFLVFAIGMLLILVGYLGIYLPYRVYRYMKKRHKVVDPEAKAWAKVVMNPDGPIRPTREYVESHHLRK